MKKFKIHKIKIIPMRSANLFIAFISGVTAATIFLVAWELLNVIQQRIDHSNIFPIGSTLLTLISDVCTFPVFWLISFLTSFPLSFFLLVVAKLSNTRNLAAYILIGIFVGLSSDFILSLLLHDFRWYTDLSDIATPTLRQLISVSLLKFAIVGAVGGGMAWATLKKRCRE